MYTTTMGFSCFRYPSVTSLLLHCLIFVEALVILLLHRYLFNRLCYRSIEEANQLFNATEDG